MMNYYMPMINHVLIDANILVGLVLREDRHHLDAVRLIRTLLAENKILVTNNYIFSEACTITLLRGKDMEHVKILKHDFCGSEEKLISITHIKPDWESNIFNLFMKQKKYRSGYLSYSDCSLIVQARKNKIKAICTFDEDLQQFSDEFDIIGV